MNSITVLAVDAGATNCRAVLCTAQGDILGYVHGGSCNYQSIGVESTQETLTAVLSSLSQTKSAPLKVNCAVFGMAGLDTKNDRVILEKIVQNALRQSNITADLVLLDNDCMMTLLGAVGDEPGVLVVSGTGSIACGITRDGKQARAGGWGYRIGDEGSGYSIGKAALTHIFRAYDGREKASQLIKAILNEMSMQNEEELMTWVYSPEFSVNRVAALTPVVCDLAEAGDWKAQSILQNTSQELAKAALAVINKLSLQQEVFDLVLLGGVLSQNQTIREQVALIIKQECPLVRVISPKYEPISGCVLRGFQALNIHDPNLLKRMSGEISMCAAKTTENNVIA